MYCKKEFGRWKCNKTTGEKICLPLTNRAGENCTECKQVLLLFSFTFTLCYNDKFLVSNLKSYIKRILEHYNPLFTQDYYMDDKTLTCRYCKETERYYCGDAGEKKCKDTW